MFCGLCVEACPYDALFMGSGFEQGQYSRKDMVITIDELRQADKRPKHLLPAPIGGPGLTTPGRAAPLDWQEVGRESWQWHQREKAGMRVSRRPLPDETIAEGRAPETAPDASGPRKSE